MEITEDRLNNILDEQRDEFQRSVEKGQQELRALLDSIIEQYQDIKLTLDGHTKMYGSLASNLKIIKADLEFIKSTLLQR